ncbi:hypothetical protein CWC16_14945 [Pseudoalteromonas sp. S3776]|nr:hypothetical protein CWC17_08170 [Pseudoalteromonas sp. S3785]TMO78894.1 hypothetical protein CWC16_14945 [Pseudoalteromonas sp. S3776]
MSSAQTNVNQRTFFVRVNAIFSWIAQRCFGIISPRLDDIPRVSFSGVIFLLIPDILGFA